MWKSKKTDRNPGLCGHYQSELDNSLIPRPHRGGKITFPLPCGLNTRSKKYRAGSRMTGRHVARLTLWDDNELHVAGMDLSLILHLAKHVTKLWHAAQCYCIHQSYNLDINWPVHCAHWYNLLICTQLKSFDKDNTEYSYDDTFLFINPMYVYPPHQRHSVWWSPFFINNWTWLCQE